MLIDRPGLARLIPHTGAMHLLDGVESWDETQIRCLTGTHRSISNPLRRAGRLGVLCGVEYAAQAMAVHAALATEGPAGRPRGGYLASLRAVHCHIDRLDRLDGTLVVEAERLFGETIRMIYRFSLSHAGVALLDGRAGVVLEAGAP